MRRSTGSDTSSKRGRRYSLRFKLFIAIMVVSVLCILASALFAGLIARQQFGRFFQEVEPPTTWPRGLAAKRQSLRYVSLGFLLAGITGAVLAVALGFPIADRISKPISELTEATRSVTRGEYGRKVELTGGKEVAELAEAFNTLSENLAENEELRRNMVADISHELRNPLATIRAELEAIQDGVIEVGPEEVESLLEETMLLSRLVEDLHQLSLAEAGKLELDLMPVGPAELVENTLRRFENEFSDRDVTGTAGIEADLPDVAADEMRTAQVLGNLVKNALVHTPAGGTVQVGAAPAGSEVEFRVRDTGAGINEEELPFVFERFYRTDRSRARATGGAGLGLSIAKSIVESQGGRIWAESEPGKGTTIRFTLPVYESAS